MNTPPDPIGAAWLANTFSVEPMARLPVMSQIGGRRSTQVDGGFRLETYPEAMRPPDDFKSHLQFHLRHEVPHLEFLARLFARNGATEIQDWINSEPTGAYARRAAFLYEWLTKADLKAPERLGGNYVDAVDDELVLAATPSKVVKVQRWRVNDNLPGTRSFCPLVVKTEAVQHASALDVRALFGELTEEFGEELLMRAAAWMTLRESKNSFAIEGESDRLSRIQRFADVMARRTGQGELPLTDALLANLQGEILGELTSLNQLGIRKSPVFVGETLRYQEIVHYIAPPFRELSDMLDGLRVFIERTNGQSPVLRSTVAAFSFVYIHPLADGNGRVHRFLINDLLRRDGTIPDPVILPISAVIMDDPGERRGYDRVLDEVSKPLMEHVRAHVEFTGTRTSYPDGVTSNFAFHGDLEALPLWRYPDLGPHVVYMSNIIGRTITEQMREQSKYMRGHQQARLAIKEVVEMPDHQADRVLRSLEQNKGILSNVLAKEMPVLARPGVWDEIAAGVELAFSLEASIDNSVVERYRPGRPMQN
ncbi:Fic family protein [Roseateles albus]|uniref:Fic family protein n=1 Tax=Roseateles albus TaxID=2987525 RepID=A0ABT5KI70_9BURK|nr:Fic family protein [Roseateles albus]MDC8773560.1 Fic family protein [Roseateles albus]